MDGISCRVSFDSAFAAEHPHQVSLIEDYVEKLTCQELKRQLGTLFPGFFTDMPSDYRLNQAAGLRRVYVKVELELPDSEELSEQAKHLSEAVRTRICSKFRSLKSRVEVEVHSAKVLATAA